MNTRILVVSLMGWLLTAPAWSQVSKYEQAMNRHITTLDTAKRRSTYTALFHAFERIHRVETHQWEPVYYMAFCAGELAKLERDPAKVDAAADRAEAFINQADSLHTPLAETLCLRSMLTFARINVDFMERGPKYLQLGNDYLKRGLKIDPQNPRVNLLLAQTMLFTPEQFGGNKKTGYVLLKEANKLYDSKLTKNLSPRWGKEDAAELLIKFEKEVAVR